MGEVIGAHADAHHIIGDIKKANQLALARGGDVAAAAVTRLGPTMTAIDQSETLLASSSDAELTAWASVDAAHAAANAAVGAVRDEMWNAIGRAVNSPLMAQIFPGGVATYMPHDPGAQPTLLKILIARIQTTAAPQWSDPLKQGWIAKIEAASAALAAANAAHEPFAAAETVAQASYRATARAGQTKLAAFKRDLKNLQMSEEQIHEIIPDTPRARTRHKGGAKAQAAEEAIAAAAAAATAACATAPAAKTPATP
jgi:hypothetical protein